MTGPRLPLDQAFGTPEAKRRYTRRLFATIAERYDVITRVLSFGRDQAWKVDLIARAGVRPGARALDLACGTGDLAFLAASRGASVVGLDFTPRMIELARLKPEARSVRWVIGDMGKLPVASSRFDLITTGYGLRNVPDLRTALAEMYRVLAPGGRLCSLDFDRPESTIVRAVYLTYLTLVGSTLGLVLHRDPDTYRYIPASIRRYPGARGVAALLREAGFDNVETIPVLGGFMAIHLAMKRGSPPAEAAIS
jgi:demethylmenaquinone methyltransferase/2-methoxy-6-polyprenyl-1,4-benzoquinol methylase